MRLPTLFLSLKFYSPARSPSNARLVVTQALQSADRVVSHTGDTVADFFFGTEYWGEYPRFHVRGVIALKE